MIRIKERKKLESILKRFPRVKLLVVGDIMMDQSILGKVSRISPEAPVPVIIAEVENFNLGGAANVAHNIRSLGGVVSLCGIVGDDENGKKMYRRIAKRGIQTQGIFTEQGRQTTVKTRIIAHHPHYQQLVRIDRETTDHPKASTFRNLSKFLTEKMEDFDGVVFSDYGKGLLTRKLIQTIISRARQSRKLIMVDPKVKNFFFFKGATVITPNTNEASEASRIPVTDRVSVEKIGRSLLKKLKCNALVITQGEKGMTIFEPHQKPYPVPTVAKEVYDVTGAGDTVIGTMALALGTGPHVSVKDAASLANYAAGIVVGKVGTAIVSSEELLKV
ncbi:MAG TPA: D-glycero-beta-D-manno-heptose-7-phosphate kinase, partial [Thermodesulfobacteriota bacterium]|nr:D-glycero-beta-D-manno-heptose-7-phosphate kinase [Thermodesulfobacteriota bacterium]